LGQAARICPSVPPADHDSPGSGPLLGRSSRARAISARMCPFLPAADSWPPCGGGCVRWRVAGPAGIIRPLSRRS